MVELTIDEKVQESRRMAALRKEQLCSAALARNAGEIDADEWDGFAARYAAAVREWQVLTHMAMASRPALTETTRGETWVQN